MGGLGKKEKSRTERYKVQQAPPFLFLLCLTTSISRPEFPHTPGQDRKEMCYLKL